MSRIALMSLSAVLVACVAGAWVSIGRESACPIVGKAKGYGSIRSVVTSASTDGLYVVLNDGTVFARRAGGDRWERRTDRAPGFEIVALGTGSDGSDVLFSDLRTGSSSTGLYRSPDGGRSWKKLSCWTVSSIAGRPSEPSSVYVATFASLSTGSGGGLYRTRDGGKVWKRSTRFPHINPHSLDVNLVAVDPLTGTVYAGLEPGGIQISTDFGQTWRFEAIRTGLLGLEGPQLSAVAVGSGKGRSVWVGSRRNGIYRRSVDGSVWKYVGFRGREVQSIVADQQFGAAAYAAVTDTKGTVDLVRTSDGGKTWKPIAGLPANALGFSSQATNNALFAWSARRVYRSTNGTTWKALPPLP